MLMWKVFLIVREYYDLTLVPVSYIKYCNIFFGSLFWFYDPQLYCFGSLSLIIVCSLSTQQPSTKDWLLNVI